MRNADGEVQGRTGERGVPQPSEMNELDKLELGEGITRGDFRRPGVDTAGPPFASARSWLVTRAWLCYSIHMSRTWPPRVVPPGLQPWMASARCTVGEAGGRAVVV